jgi:dUTP pyrophosphatase
LIDSGAQRTFIDNEVVKRNNLPTNELTTPFTISLADGSTSPQIIDKTTTIETTIGDNHQEQLTCHITDSLTQPIILGLDWMKIHNPTFDFDTLDVQFDSPHCQTNCNQQEEDNNKRLGIKLMTTDATMPTKGSNEAIGFDLYSADDITIHEQSQARISTDLAIQLPKGTYGRIAPRSGLAMKHWINVHAGVIDPDYNGIVRVLLFNHSKEPFIIKKGDRIAQIIVEEARTVTTKLITDIKSTERGTKGFGSTGMNTIELNATTDIYQDNYVEYNIKDDRILLASIETTLKQPTMIPMEYSTYKDIFEDLLLGTLPPH